MVSKTLTSEGDTVKILSRAQEADSYKITVIGGDIRLEHREEYADKGQPFIDGTATVIEDLEGTFGGRELWAYAEDINSRSGATIEIHPGNFSFISPIQNILGRVGLRSDRVTTVGQNATVFLGPGRQNVDILYNLTGAGDVVVEIRDSTVSWREVERFSEGAATTAPLPLKQFTMPWFAVRARATANLDFLEISTKGV